MRYFRMTRRQYESLVMESVFYGFPYEAPFFGLCLVDGKTNPIADDRVAEWEKKHGPMPPITIIDD